MNEPSNSSDLPVIYLNAFLRSLLTPSIVWCLVVILATLANQPGVVCITPMAWLLALWSGVQYIRLSDGRPGRYRLLGPALLGASLGLVMGVIFSLVTYLKMPVSSPGDVFKSEVLTLILLVSGMVVCAGFCTLTAWLTLRQYTRDS